jgi:predicted branched-subunit amino acid permease
MPALNHCDDHICRQSSASSHEFRSGHPLSRAARSLLTLFAYGVTDESFAVNYPKLIEGNWQIEHALVVNHAANLTWIVSTIIGGYGGQYIPEGAFGIDYALIAMFICLLIFQLRGRVYLFTAIVAGASGRGALLMLPGNWHIIAASMLAATIGTIIKRQHMRSAE